MAMNGQFYEALVARDEAMLLKPELASSWSSAPDGWTFNLRKGVKFHDGADFTAEDVVFSFNRAKHEASDYKEQAKNVVSVEVIDDYTVKLFSFSSSIICGLPQLLKLKRDCSLICVKKLPFLISVGD